MSKFKKVADAIKNLTKSEAEKILSKVDTAEKAVALKGAERAEYLSALDTVHGPRDARAKDMGFGDKTYYHGTNKNFNKFDLDKFGQGSGEKGSGRGAWFTDSPKVASEFSDHASFAENRMYQKFESDPRWKKADKELIASYKADDKEAATNARKIMSAVAAEYDDYGTNIIPAKLKLNPDTINEYNSLSAKQRGEKFGSALNKGHDSAVFKGISDSPVQTVSDVAVVSKPNQVRSTNAAFDPRFKDSDLIMSANSKVPKSVGGKIMDTITAPQRYAMNKIAEVLGAKGDKLDSEKSAVAIADKVQSKLGIPDSKATSVAKALGVAGLEVFADPTNVIPIGKIAKGAKMAGNAVAPASMKSLEKLVQAVMDGKLKLSTETLKRFRNTIKANNVGTKTSTTSIQDAAKELKTVSNRTKFSGMKELTEAIDSPHVLFTVQNPAVKGKSPSKVRDVFRDLKNSGEDVKLVSGNYGDPELSIMVKNPKNMEKIQGIAVDSGQDSMFISGGKNSQNMLLNLNNDNTGKAVMGSGYNITKTKPSGNYTKMNTAEGPVYYQGNLDFSKEPEAVYKHFSKNKNISELNPEMAGTGVKSAQYKQGVPSTKSSYHYPVMQKPEAMVTENAVPYFSTAPKGNILDMSAEIPADLLAQAKKAYESTTKYKTMQDAVKGIAKERGFVGTKAKLNSGEDIAENFYPTKVIPSMAPDAQFMSRMKDVNKPQTAAQAMPNKFENVPGQTGPKPLMRPIEPKQNFGKVTVNAPESPVGTVRNISQAPTQNTIIMKPGEIPVRLENTTNIGSDASNVDYKLMDELKRRKKQGF